MKKLLRTWHWLHTWSLWENEPLTYVAYPWTQPGHYAHTQQYQTRKCETCGVSQRREVL